MRVAVILALFTGAAYADTLEGASWRMSADGLEAQGLIALDGGDGATAPDERGGLPCLTNRPSTTPPSQFIYFDVDNARSADLSGPLYLLVEYYGGGIGGAIGLHYDSATGDGVYDAYRPCERQWGGWFIGDHAWKRAVFLLELPRFAGRQNGGADFRLTGTPLYIRSVALSHEQPADCADLEKETLQTVAPRVRIGDGGQLIVGGFDPDRRDSDEAVRALRNAVPGLKALGVTSHEGYVRWNLCEIEPGRYDWSVYDAFVEVYKQSGLKWVPFLIVGSAYSLPDWYYKQPGSQGYICLEHGEQSDVQSLWNPVLREHVGRFIRAFCEHYGPTGVIEGILLGVTGNYGEAIYIASGNDWTASIHGEYHTHHGFWAGDPYAVESFRQAMTAKYADIASLNKAWDAEHASFADVKPFLRDDAPSDRAWLDFCHWYIGSMSDWSRFWLTETRKHFPNGDIYLCTGGHAPAEHGADFGDQCKIAAEINGGVRITNEASDYAGNYSLTRWVASAGRQYGAYFSFEPAGGVSADGVVARIYNATASGAKGLHYYYGNLFDSEKATANFVAFGEHFKQRQPVVEIFVYYPETHILLNGADFLPRVQPLRDRFDFGYLSDHQVLDGGLKQAKALVLLHGNVSEAPVWQAIVDWVREGGLVLYADGIGRLRTVEGDETPHNALLGATRDTGKGRSLAFHGKHDSVEYRDFLSKALAEAPELPAATRAMVAADGKEDKAYVTLSAPDELLWLSQAEGNIDLPGGAALPPHAIATTSLP